jgi:glutamyl-tRNA synthetase
LREKLVKIGAKAAKFLDAESFGRLSRFRAILASLAEWSVDVREETGRRFSEAEGVKLGTVAQPLRAALTGKTNTPGIFNVMEVLGRDAGAS